MSARFKDLHVAPLLTWKNLMAYKCSTFVTAALTAVNTPQMTVQGAQLRVREGRRSSKLLTS